MDASKLPRGKSAEKTGDGGPVHQPGIYVHNGSGAKFITAPGEEGVVQADALFNREVYPEGWERVGDVPSRTELLEMQKTQQVKDAAEEALQKGLEAKEQKEAVKKATAEAQAKIDEDEANTANVEAAQATKAA